MIIDLHNDAAMKLLALGVSMHDEPGPLQVDMAGIRVCRPAALVFAAYCDPHFTGADAEALVAAQIEALTRDFRRADSPVELAGGTGDVARIVASGRTAAILGVEGGYAIDADLAPLERFHALGVRLMTLTHSRATSWAGADTDGAARGLTAFGERVVARMNELGMIVDVAHASTETILAAARVSRRPVIYSHGGVRALAKSNRAIDDAAIRAIAATGGVVGMSFFPLHLVPGTGSGWASHAAELERQAAEIMAGPDGAAAKFRELAQLFGQAFPVPPDSERPGLDPLLDNMEHVIRLVGDEHVALGSDLDGIAYTVRGLERLASMGVLVHAMRARGWDEERIRRVMGANARRVIEEVLPGG